MGEMIELAKAGDEAAWSSIYACLAPRFRRVAYRFFPYSPQEHDDFVQHSMTKIFCTLHSFEGRSAFTSWATRIAMNEALMQLRKGKRERKAGTVYLDEPIGDSETFFMDLAAPFLDPSMALDVDTLLAALRPDDRRALETYYIEGASLAETADSLGVSVGCVKSRISRALIGCHRASA